LGSSMRSPVRALLGAALCVSAAVLSGCNTAGPREGSIEYILSPGLRAVNAQPAFDAGYTGRGVTVALIDCALDKETTDLKRNLSPLSTDLNPERKVPVNDRHADEVAAPFGAALNGRGLAGVAYNATVLAIRADFDGGWRGRCGFYPRDIARALDYAVEKGARVVLLPFRADRNLGTKFEEALERVVAAGVAVVISGGNESEGQPSWPARYATDPRYEGSIVIAGGARNDGKLASWSNRAGIASGWFVIAPGEEIITDCDDKFCQRVSGTSVSAAYVAGGLALIMQAQPNIHAREAIKRLLSAARPVGEPEDAGRGSLDIGAAFAF
jgi:subtilisin family serine protease